MTSSSNDESCCLVAELLNEGAHFITMSQYDEATYTLHIALKVSQNVLEGPSAQHLSSEIVSEAYTEIQRIRERSARRESRQRLGGVTASTEKFHTQDMLMHEHDSSTPSLQGFVYREPIRLVDRYQIPCIRTLTLYASFNMGLAQHLKILDASGAASSKTSGPSKKKFSKSRILKALEFYKLASAIESNTSDLRISATYSIAIINNMAQLFQFSGRKSQADHLFHVLLDTLVYVVDCGNGNRVQDMESFFLNVSHLVSNTAAFAPAA